MFHFYSPWKHQKTSGNLRFSDVFRGYRTGTLVENGLKWSILRQENNSANIYLFKLNNRNTRKKVWYLFKFNDNITRKTPFWCFYCWFWTYFTPFSSVSIVDSEQVNISWESTKTNLTHFTPMLHFHIPCSDGFTRHRNRTLSWRGLNKNQVNCPCSTVNS